MKTIIIMLLAVVGCGTVSGSSATAPTGTTTPVSPLPSSPRPRTLLIENDGHRALDCTFTNASPNLSFDHTLDEGESYVVDLPHIVRVLCVDPNYVTTVP